MKINRIVSILGALLLSLAALAPAQNQPIGFMNGWYGASSFNYVTYIGVGNSASGAATIFPKDSFVVSRGGTTIVPFSILTSITVLDGANSETVTPTAVSGCNYGSAQSPPYSCAVTATFTFTHGGGAQIVSGSGGAGEAAIYASQHGGGFVALDNTWGLPNSSTWTPASFPVFGNVLFDDNRGTVVQDYWVPAPNSLSFIATPTALTAQAACDATHTFCSDANIVGTWTSGQVFGCIAYVDAMGNEGACSTTANIGTTVASKAIDVGAPAASTGAVGYTIYLSLVGGSYAFAYQVPITSTICVPTQIETTTPACSLVNATYGQSSSNAVVAAVTVNTSPLALQLGTISTTSDYVGNSNAHTAYVYAPTNRFPMPGIVTQGLPFSAGSATVGSTVPQVIGTIAIPPGFMNQIGKGIHLCGKETMTGASATIEKVQIWWDGAGSNAAGVPVNIANLASTGLAANTAAVYNGNFCIDLFTTVSGAGVTAGSIEGGYSSFIYYLGTVPTSLFLGGDTFTAATGSLNLAGTLGFTTRIHIVQLHTTGTDVSPQLLSYTLQPL